MDDVTSDDFAAALEHIDSQLTAIVEGQVAMAGMPAGIDSLQVDMTDVKADIRTIKIVMTDHSRQLDNHEGHLSNLEADS